MKERAGREATFCSLLYSIILHCTALRAGSRNRQAALYLIPSFVSALPILNTLVWTSIKFGCMQARTRGNINKMIFVTIIRLWSHDTRIRAGADGGGNADRETPELDPSNSNGTNYVNTARLVWNVILSKHQKKTRKYSVLFLFSNVNN